MESKTFEEAEKYYNENKDFLVEIIDKEFQGTIDHQIEFDQVAVWFNGFSLCYQNGDMNGRYKGSGVWRNDGADCGLEELQEILKKDTRFQPLIASEEYWEMEYLKKIINDFCADFAEKYKIDEYFSDEEEIEETD